MEELICGDRFNSPLPDQLPRSLTKIEFGRLFDHSIHTLRLPSNLREIIFGGRFTKIIMPDDFPVSLTKLKFYGHYPYLRDLLPRLGALKVLELEYVAKEPIISLPPNLEELICGEHFQSTLPDELPRSLTKLEFGRRFNEPINHLRLPINLREMIFGEHFNQTLPDELPASLTKLKFDFEGNFDRQLPDLPRSLVLDRNLFLPAHYDRSRLRWRQEKSV